MPNRNKTQLTDASFLFRYCSLTYLEHLYDLKKNTYALAFTERVSDEHTSFICLSTLLSVKERSPDSSICQRWNRPIDESSYALLKPHLAISEALKS